MTARQPDVRAYLMNERRGSMVGRGAANGCFSGECAYCAETSNEQALPLVLPLAPFEPPRRFRII